MRHTRWNRRIEPVSCQQHHRSYHDIEQTPSSKSASELWIQQLKTALFRATLSVDAHIYGCFMRVLSNINLSLKKSMTCIFEVLYRNMHPKHFHVNLFYFLNLPHSRILNINFLTLNINFLRKYYTA